LVVPEPRTAREIRAARGLLRADLLRETRKHPGRIEWRRDEEGVSFALIAIFIEEPPQASTNL
jgi:hypothetical protein